MLRAKRFWVLLGGLVLIALGGYLAYRGRLQPASSVAIAPQAGLSWLPAESNLVGGIDLAVLRQQTWLLETIDRATGEVREDPDYRAFVEGTGFNYTRDLDRLWIGLLDTDERPLMTGIAEGRFNRAQILAYTRQQGGNAQRHHGFEIYEVRTASEGDDQRQRHFAIVFLDATHLGFASNAQQAKRVIDCWLGRAPAVDSDQARQAKLLRQAAGWQAWAVDTSGRWQSLLGERQSDQLSQVAIMSQLAVGLRVNEQGLEVAAKARCRERAQAQRLRDYLNLLLLVGQMALRTQPDETTQIWREVLEELNFAQRDNTVEAHLRLSTETVARLLQAVPAPTRQP